MNASPEAMLADGFCALFDGVDVAGVVVEITEHVPVESYDQLLDVLAPLRALGLRLAVDDAGAGFASFRHVTELRPDIVKLDLSITRNVVHDVITRSLVRSWVALAEELDARLLAEGVEHVSQRDELLDLGVHHGQGWLYGAAAPVAEVPWVGEACRRIPSATPAQASVSRREVDGTAAAR